MSNTDMKFQDLPEETKEALIVAGIQAIADHESSGFRAALTALHSKKFAWEVFEAVVERDNAEFEARQKE
jgi:hypothetical protein